MKRGKRILSLLLALVMSVGMFTGLATTAFAATEEMTLYMPSFILLPPQHFCGGTYSTNII